MSFSDKQSLPWRLFSSVLGLVIVLNALMFLVLSLISDFDISIGFCFLGIGLGWFCVFSNPKKPELELTILSAVIILTFYAMNSYLFLKGCYGLIPLSYVVYGIGKHFNPFKITYRAFRIIIRREIRNFKKKFLS